MRSQRNGVLLLLKEAWFQFTYSTGDERLRRSRENVMRIVEVARRKSKAVSKLS